MNLNFEFENELTECFKKLDINKDNNIFITGNVGSLARVRIERNLKMSLLLKALKNRIGKNGSVFSPSASMNLMNTNIPFDIDNTPSNKMGAFAEYFRQLPDSIRTRHPFWSVSGQGPDAFRLKNVSRHAFGVGSPWSIFLDLDVKQINMGMHPSRSVTLIHHIELVFGVPYRYTKEFNHPIINGNKINNELFYQSVFYRESQIKKRIELNMHFFDELELRGKLKHIKHSSGLNIWSFNLKDFYDTALEFFKEDIYTYLEEVPLIKPYTK